MPFFRKLFLEKRQGVDKWNIGLKRVKDSKFLRTFSLCKIQATMSSYYYMRCNHIVYFQTNISCQLWKMRPIWRDLLQTWIYKYYLTHFMPLVFFSFYTPEKHTKTQSFWCFREVYRKSTGAWNELTISFTDLVFSG